MVDKMEMSLDDIIKTTKGARNAGRKGGAPRQGGSPRKGGRPSGSSGFRGGKRPAGPSGGSGGVLKGRSRGGIQKSKLSRGDVNSAWKHDLYDGPRRGGLKAGGSGPVGGVGSAKLLVSNLDYGVSETDVHELFAEFGSLRNASVHYDRSGRSLGTADVVFERRADAVKAMKQYNGVPLDGRPMNIQLATSELPSAGPTKSRLGTSPRSNKPANGARRPAGNAPRKGGPQQSGRRGGGRGPRVNKPAPTAEELDAELDAYVNDMK